MHHTNYIWMLMRPHKIGFNYLHGRDWALYQFLKYIQTKKSLKFAVLDLFGAFLYQFDWMGEFYDRIYHPIIVICELFPEFQWTVFMEIAKQITGT